MSRGISRGARSVSPGSRAARVGVTVPEFTLGELNLSSTLDPASMLNGTAVFNEDGTFSIPLQDPGGAFPGPEDGLAFLFDLPPEMLHGANLLRAMTVFWDLNIGTSIDATTWSVMVGLMSSGESRVNAAGIAGTSSSGTYQLVSWIWNFAASASTSIPGLTDVEFRVKNAYAGQAAGTTVFQSNGCAQSSIADENGNVTQASNTIDSGVGVSGTKLGLFIGQGFGPRPGLTLTGSLKLGVLDDLHLLG